MATITSQAPSIQPGSPELEELLERIAAGAETRERELTPPFEAIGWIKEAGSGGCGYPSRRAVAAPACVSSSTR